MLTTRGMIFHGMPLVSLDNLAKGETQPRSVPHEKTLLHRRKEGRAHVLKTQPACCSYQSNACLQQTAPDAIRTSHLDSFARNQLRAMEIASRNEERRAGLRHPVQQYISGKLLKRNNIPIYKYI